ncbi:MAG: hypothetical protein CMH60_07125 [Myxococcales bacterium]|nr:hypothetical protein [Myxococcales bacterium]
MKDLVELQQLQEKVDRGEASAPERQEFITLLQKAQRHGEIAHYLDRWESEVREEHEASVVVENRVDRGPNDAVPVEAPSIEDDVSRVQRYLGLADVYAHQLGKVEEAQRILRRALEYHPGEPKLIRRLADLLALNRASYPEAAKFYSLALQNDPFEQSILRMLGRIAGHLQVSDRAYGYYSALLALNPKDTEAANFVRHCRSEKPWVLNRQVRSASWTEYLKHPKHEGIMGEMIEVMRPALRQAQPGDLSRWGIQASERLSLIHPKLLSIRFLFDAFGLDTVDTYLWQDGGLSCRFEECTRPTLLVGGDLLAQCTDREKSFLLARMNYLYAKGYEICEKLDTRALAALFASFCALVGFDDVYGANAETEAWKALLEDHISAEAKESLRALAPIYAGAVDEEMLQDWRQGVLASADRAALLVSCDIDEALDTLFRYRNIRLGSMGREKVFANYGPAKELFRFALSEEYFTLRERLGWNLRPQY